MINSFPVMPNLYRLLHLVIPVQMALSPALWWPGSGRTFPLLQVVNTGAGIPAWVSGVLSGIFVLAILAYAAGKLPVRYFAPAALVLLALLAALDLNRLQVWMWMWCMFWLADIAVLNNKNHHYLHAWIIAGMYAWSGLHKLTPWFSTNFDWFCAAFPVTQPLSGNLFLSYGAATFELLLAPMLLWPAFRRTGMALTIGLHLYILLVIGPLGYHWNIVVWPWNLVMIGLVWHFFNHQQAIRPRFSIPGVLILVMVWIMPALNIWEQWPETLSWKMYSNTQREATVFSKNGLPCEKLQTIWQKRATDNQYLMIDDWSDEDLHVPAFNSRRNFEKALRSVQHCAADTSKPILLKILTVDRWDRQGNQSFETIY